MDDDFLKRQQSLTLGSVATPTLNVGNVGGGSLSIAQPKSSGTINLAPSQPSSNLSLANPQSASSASLTPKQPNIQGGQNPTANVGGANMNTSGKLNLKSYTPKNNTPVKINNQQSANSQLGQVAQNQPHGLFGKITHDVTAFGKPIVGAVKNVAESFIQPAENMGRVAITNPVRSLAAEATGNQTASANADIAQQNALKSLGSEAHGALTFIPQVAAQIGLSAPGSGATSREWTPQGDAMQFVYGNQPIQSIENVYKTNAQQGGAFAGAGGVAASALTDVLGLLGAKEGVEKFGPGLEKVGNTLKSVAGEPALKASETASGLNRANIVDQNDAQKLTSFAQTGMYTPDMHDAANKAGINLTTGNPDQMRNDVNEYLQRRDIFLQTHTQVAQGGYIGGQQAETFDEKNLTGQTFTGAEGKQRFEGDDSKATVNIMKPEKQARENLQSLPTTRIPTDNLTGTDLEGGTALDPVTVAQNVKALQSGRPLDPILVTPGEDGQMYVEDGKNRLAAYQQLGITSVPAKVITRGAEQDLPTTLGATLNHPSLFRDYPQLQNVNVKTFTPKNERLAGGFNEKTNTIHINKKLLENPAVLKKTLLHETQHVIQKIEGFSKGTNPKTAGGEAAYRGNLGEQEAYRVGSRVNLNPAERARNPFQARIARQTIQDIRIGSRKQPTPADFANSLDYGMSHRPTQTGATADDVTQNKSEMGLPKDFYEHPEYYSIMHEPTYRESFEALQKVRGKPDADVTIYRAGPKNELNEGDWVTLSKKYAALESQAENVPINTFKVKAKDIEFAGDDINEFGYYPKTNFSASLAEPLEFGNEQQIRQAKADNEGGQALETAKNRQIAKAETTAQPNEQSLFGTNNLLKEGGQSDIFSGEAKAEKPTSKVGLTDAALSENRTEGKFREAKFNGETGVREYATGKLGDFLKYDDLFKQYPYLKDVNVEFVSSQDTTGENGGYIPKSNTIRLDSSLSDRETFQNLVHEAKHVVQNREGRIENTTKVGREGGYEAYKNHPLEEEARKQADEALKLYDNGKTEPTATSQLSSGTDRFGNNFSEQMIPVDQLQRETQYQPRVTASGKGTEESVFKSGYRENPAQPVVVMKQGDKYMVLGGHSRTLGLERRAEAGLSNPEAVKARVYDNITPEQARQISRGANQGVQYESTLDMAKSIADARAEGQEPAVPKQNLIKGYSHDDYEYLWNVAKEDRVLQDKIMQGSLPSDEILAAARQGRIEKMPADTVSAVINGLDKNGNFSRQNAINVIKLLSGKIKANIAKDSQTGLFGTVEQAVRTTDLLKEYQKISGDLTRKRNALATATKELKGTPAEELLNNLVDEYNSKLKNIQDEVVARYRAANPGAAIAEDIRKYYTPSHAVTPDEERAFSYLMENPKKAMDDYDVRTMKEFGSDVPNIVAGDEAKFVIPGFDATMSAPYHEPASALAKVKYQELLDNPETKDQPVMLMAGGSGAGKTSSLSHIMEHAGEKLSDFAAVIDTNSNKLHSASNKIDQALKSGRQVVINYVYRDPVDAFVNGVVPRAAKIGRLVPVAAHLDTHFGSNEVIRQLEDKYKDNPNVVIHAIDNSKGQGKQAVVPLENIPDLSYNRGKVETGIERSLQDAKQKGTISNQDYAAYTGQRPETPSDVGQVGRSTSEQPSAAKEPTDGEVTPEKPSGVAIKPTEPAKPVKIGPQGELFKRKEPFGFVPTREEPYTGPNLNEGAFSKEDQQFLNRELDKTEVGLGNMKPEEYADKYGLTRQQVELDVKQMSKDDSKRLNMTPDQLKNFGDPLTIRQKRELIATDPRQFTNNQVDMIVPEGNIQSGIAKATGISEERTSRYDQAEYYAKKLDSHDKDLLYRYDNGENISDLADEAHNRDQFLKASNAAIDAMDYSLAADRAGFGATLRQQSYVPHYYRLSEKEMDEQGVPQDQRIKIGGVYRGYRDISAKYKSYIEAHEKAGLQPLYKDPFEAIKEHGRAGTLKIRNQLLLTAMAKAAPNDIESIDTVRSINGEPVKPAANGNLPFAATDRVNKALTNFQPEYHPTSVVGKAVEKGVQIAGSGTKKALFLGSPFHQAHITENVGFASVLGGDPGVFGEGLMNEVRAKGGLTRGTYYDLIDHYRRNGVLDFARNDMGMVLHDKGPLDRFINSYALSLAKGARDGGIEPGSQEAIDLGKIYNRLLGRDNAAVNARNPTIEKMTSYFALAPHYLRTQLRLVWDALAPKKLGGAGYDRPLSLHSPGGAARSAVLGPRVLGALAAITASAIIMHRFPTWQQAVNESGLNPNNTNPNVDIKSRNAKGETQVMNLPTDPAGLAFGFVTDPKHFFQSRYSPLLSFATKAITNTNWNGTPLVDTNQPNQIPLRIARAAENAFTPIGVQNFTNFGKNVNNPNIEQGIAQEFGLRLKTNPNDPQVKANATYFAALRNINNQLKNSGQYGNYWAQVFANLHPSNTTDASGMKYPTPYEPLSSEQKYAAYVDSSSGNPQLSPVFYADQKLATLTKGYPSSPLYSLSGNGTGTDGQSAPKALVALEYQHAQDPAAKTVIMNANGGQNGWLANYETKVGQYSQNYQQNLTNYLQGLGWQPKAIDAYWQKHPSTPDPIDQVNFDKRTNDLINQYYNLSSSGNSTAASQFFSQHANVLGNAFDLMAQHANAVRGAKGELQLQGYPQESAHVASVLNSMPAGSDPASKKARGQLINGNPDVSQYLADVALYEALSKGAQFRYVNPVNPAATEGQNINAGGQAGQTFLKDTQNLGAYDIGKNATGQFSFMQNGGFPSGTTTGSSSSSSSRGPLVPLPPRLRKPSKGHAGKPYIRKIRAKSIHLHKSGSRPVQILHGGNVAKPIKVGSIK